MSIYNFFKNIFGVPSSDNQRNFGDESRNYEDPRNRAWEEQQSENYRDNMREPPGDSYNHFSMFTDPLEMHRYFEQQMDEVMRSFEGFFGNRSEEQSPFGSGNLGDWFTPEIDGNQDYAQIEPPKNNVREHYLKPGYERPTNRDTEHPKDSDLDGKLDFESLDSILQPKPRQELIPRQPNTQPRTSFYGKSISSRTVHRPDGSVEIHRTTKDHEGNEETVVTRQIGDKHYSVTTRRNKDGKEEKIEDMVNIDEKDISQFLNIWQQPQNETPHDDPNRHFPFDKFFK